MKGSGGMEEHYVEGCMSCHEELDGFRTKYVVSPSERWAYCMECFDEMKGRDDVIINDAETFEAQFVGDFNRATMNEDYWLACPNSVYSGGTIKIVRRLFVVVAMGMFVRIVEKSFTKLPN